MKILQILVLIFGFIVSANAQKTTLNGTVFDPNGAVIITTKIVAVNSKGQKFESIVDDDGKYTLELPVATYSINFSAPGFKNVKIENYEIVNSYNGKMSFDISLNVVGNGIACVLTVESPSNVSPTTNEFKVYRPKSKFIKRKNNK
jgi:hypothetical protein